MQHSPRPVSPLKVVSLIISAIFAPLMVFAGPPDNGPDGIPPSGRFSVYFQNMIGGNTPATGVCPANHVIIGFNTGLTLNYGKPICQLVETLPSGVIGQTLRHDGNEWIANSLLYNDGTRVGVNTVNPVSTLDVAGSVFTRGAQAHFDMSFANSGSTQWVRVGTLTIPQGGYNATLRFYGGSGYNANSTQNGEFEINFRTSNGASVNANGFCASAQVFRTGRTQIINNVKIVSNASGCSATSFDFYIQLSSFIGAGYYTVDTSYSATWSHVLAIGANDPGASSATVLVPVFENVINDNFNVFGTGYISGNLGVGTANPSYKLDVVGTGQLTGLRLPTGASTNYVLVSDATGNTRWTSTGSIIGGVTETDPQVGTNTTNYISKWNGSALVSSQIFDNATNVGVGTALPGYRLDVAGTGAFYGIRVTSGAINNYILASDATGNARWVSTGSLIGGVTETDPLVYAWAKAATKPTYNFTEITGTVTDAQVPDTITINTATNATQLGGVGAASYALLASPTFTGDPKAPTPGTADNDTSIATTAYVKAQGFVIGGTGGTEVDPEVGSNTADYLSKWNGTALVTSQVYDSGSVGIGTSSPSEKLTVAGTGAFYGIKISSGASTNYVLASDASGNARWVSTGSLISIGAETDPTIYAWAKAATKPAYNFSELAGTVTDAQVPDTITINTATNATQLGGVGAASYALLASPALTGTPTAPTSLLTDSGTRIATTGFVKGQGYLTSYTETDPIWTSQSANYALLASPALTGTPTAPTSLLTDSGTRIATTGFVKGQGFLTSYTETDPTIYAWAKAATKPAYNFSELAGTVTDAQVPDTITINTAASANAVSFNGGLTTTSAPTFSGLTITNSQTVNGDLTVVGKVITDTLVNRTVAQLTVSGSIFPNATSSQKDLGANGNRWANIWLSGNAYVTGSVYSTAGFVGNLTGNASTATNATQLGGVGAASYALLASPTFTGDPKAPTPLTADNDTSVATTAYVKAQGFISSYTETDPLVYAWAKAATKPAYNFSELAGTVTDAQVPDNITISSANSVSSPDGTRNAADKLPTTSPRAVRFDFATAASSNGGGNYAGVMTYAPWLGTTASTGDASYQLAFNSAAANAAGMPYLSLRNGINSTWNSWYTILHSGNYNTYTPTKTGSGASGTWGISVTGNAATATTASAAPWSGITGTPTTLAGYGVTNFYSQNSSAPVGADATTTNGHYYVNANISQFGVTDGGLFVQGYSSSWASQIFQDYRTGQLGIRGKNNGVWMAWRSVLDSTNYNVYTPTKTGSGASGTWGISVTGNSATTSTVGANTLNYIPKWNGTALVTGTIVDSGSKIGIGIATPSEKLHVVGNVQADQFYFNSDQRLKSDITPLTDSLSKINALSGYSYILKSTGEQDVGVIAQEVETVFPDLVKTDKTTGMKAVQYGNLVAPIIEAVKEITQRIDSSDYQIGSHKKDIEALKNQNEIIQSENKKLKEENKLIKTKLDAIERRLNEIK